MTVADHVTNVIIRLSDCVVMGIGVTPEKYRLLHHGATEQDYVIFVRKALEDTCLVGSRMGGEHLQATALTISGVSIGLYLVEGDRGKE